MDTRTLLYQLNPIVSSTRDDDPSMLSLPGQQGESRGTYNLRLASTVDAVGWDEAIKLGEIDRLVKAFDILIKEHTP